MKRFKQTAILALAALGLAAGTNASLITPPMGDMISESPDTVTPDDIATVIANDLFPRTQIPINLAQDILFFAFDGAVSASHFTFNFNLNPDGATTSSGTITWDLSGTGLPLTYVALTGPEGDFAVILTVYSVTPDEAFQSGGVQPIAMILDEPFTTVTFFSLPFGGPRPSVPDNGSTLVLFGSVVAAFASVRRIV